MLDVDIQYLNAFQYLSLLLCVPPASLNLLSGFPFNVLFPFPLLPPLPPSLSFLYKKHPPNLTPSRRRRRCRLINPLGRHLASRIAHTERHARRLGRTPTAHDERRRRDVRAPVYDLRPASYVGAYPVRFGDCGCYCRTAGGEG